MARTTVVKITINGQISLPAPVRKRWRAARVVIEDGGDRVMVRPLPDDPVAAACGSLRGHRAPSETVRGRERRSAAARERRRALR